MKLLFDEHLSFRLVRRIQDVFPESRSLTHLNLQTSTDKEIWQFALREDFTILTRDDDFVTLSLVNGAPPKVIWLKIPNLTNDQIEIFLRGQANLIADFAADAHETLLILKDSRST